MTLMVCAYRLAKGEWIDLDVPSPLGGEPTLAGLEATRFNFYGSDKAKRLGLKILPQLATNNIYAEGMEELDALRAEVKILFDNLDSSDDYWPFRLGNILRAIECAKQYGDAGRVFIF